MTPQPGMADAAPQILQAIAALLIVLGLIFGVAYALRRFAFGNMGAIFTRRSAPEKTLRLVETLWLDARHRIVVVQDGARRHTLLLNQGQPLELDRTQEPTP